MASRCTSTILRAGRLASQSRTAAVLQAEAANQHGAAAVLLPQQLSGDRIGNGSLLPHCAQGQRRWAQTKADKQEAKKAAASGAQEGNLNSKIQSMLKALEPHEIPPSQLSKEDLAEHKRIAKEYSRMKMKEHRSWQKRMSTKIKLQQAAIAALPEELQDHARTPDYEDFPSDRWIPTHTAPVEGYMESQGSDDRQKRRR